MELNEYLSESHKKRKKQRRQIFAQLGAGCVLLALILVAWVFVRSPLFRLNEITVSGNDAMSSADIVTLAQSAFGKSGSRWLGIRNLLAWPSSFASGDIVVAPQLESATLTKDYFHHALHVAVVERKPFAIWCMMPSAGSETTAVQDGSCYWFDRAGVMFSRTFDAQGNLIFSVHDYSQNGLGVHKTIVSSRFVADVISVLDTIRASDIRVKEIRLNDIALEEMQVTTYNGPDLEFSIRFPAAGTLAVLQSLIAKPGFSKLQYIDFRTEDRAYYK